MLGGLAAKRGADCQSLEFRALFDSRLGLTWAIGQACFWLLHALYHVDLTNEF
jgi:hypothetical protein